MTGGERAFNTAAIPDEEATASRGKRVALAQSPDDKPDDAALRARLDRLSSSLDNQERQAPKPEVETNNGFGKAMSTGFLVLSELVAAVVISAVIGWQLDKWLHTSPILLIVFLALGTVAGFWNVYRIAAKPTSGPGSGRGPL